MKHLRLHAWARMLGFGLSKTRMLVLTGEIHSVKVGRNRILPAWVEEYVQAITAGPGRQSA